MTHLCAMAPHHIPAGEAGLPVIETVEARRIAQQWGNARHPALATFAARGHLGALSLAEAVWQARVNLAEHCATPEQAYGLRLLLVHLQGLAENRGLHHVDDEPYWCWCQPYASPARAARTA